jgi:hypothetical protein
VWAGRRTEPRMVLCENAVTTVEGIMEMGIEGRRLGLAEEMGGRARE